MNLLLVISLIATVAEISAIVQNAVLDYFESEILKSVTKTWQRYQIAYEHTLYLAMQESYGYKGMNVYVKRPPFPMRVSTGYYHTDNQVHLFLDDLKLEDYPHLEDPKISLPLLSNVIQIDGMVSKMNIHANYIVFRNTSFIVYDRAEQDPYKTSPFLFEQVQNTGQLAITVEECKLSGLGIVVLTGETVSLGSTMLKLRNCQFNLEIFTPGVASPPVVANYLLKSKGGVGLTLEDVLIKPLSTELLPKLQAALHSYINTTAILMEEFALAQLAQHAVFEKTLNYMNNVIRNLNILTINRNKGKIVMDDLIIPYNDTMQEGAANSLLTLTNLVMTGTETLYSAHTGGPYKTDITKIYEQLRFGTIQVTGSMTLQVMDKTEGMYDFAAEIRDVETDVTFHVERRSEEHEDAQTTPICITARRDGQQTKKPIIRISPDEYSIEVTGWRALAFSSPSNKFVLSEAVVTGHLLHVVPYYLKRHLENILADAVIEADKEYQTLVKMMNNGTNMQLHAANGNAKNIGAGIDQHVDIGGPTDIPNEDKNSPEVRPESEVDFDHPVIHTEPSNIAEPQPDNSYLFVNEGVLDDDVELKPQIFADEKFSEILNKKPVGSLHDENQDSMYDEPQEPLSNESQGPMDDGEAPEIYKDDQFSEIGEPEHLGPLIEYPQKPTHDDAMVERRQLRKGRYKLRQRKNVKSLRQRKLKHFKLENPVVNEIRRNK